MEVNPNFSDRAKEDFFLIQSALEHKSSAAYEKLLLRYKDSVFFMLLKMVHNRDDAEDLTIEAFGKAFNRLEKYSSEYSFSTWLYKIATNNAIDFLRKKRIETYSINAPMGDDESPKDHSHNIPSEALDPEEVFIKKQRADNLRTMLEKLNVKYRTLIEKRYFDELSYEEIAESMQMPLGTVKAQLFRAKELLYTILKNNNSY
jgi:RNA polymerase sigma-70 factor (ECF subfamily)